MKQICRKFAVLATTIAALTACTRPYDTPEFRGSMSFAGASDLVKDSGRVRVIMTHGMCSGTHQAFGGPGLNWVADRSEIIAQLVDDPSYERKPPNEPYEISAEYFGTARSPAIARYDLEIQGSDGTIYELRMLKWGQSFQTATNALDVLENQIQRPPIIRASLNNTLKTSLMDDCLVDAVAYSGARGNSLRSAYREAMCDLMGGSIGGENLGRPRETVTCVGMGTGSQMPTILVPESLGSKIMMDAILSIEGNNKEKALGPVRAIHLATNQIPLLSQAEAENAAGEGFANERELRGAGDFRTLIRQLSSTTRSQALSDPISVVVYSDPNDLVGYPLTSQWIPDDGTATLTNVLISNGDNYFGAVANPLDAHRGTARPQVFKMILYGSDAEF